MKWFDTENRSIKILSLLEHKSEISVNELSGRLTVSTKTIQNAIRQINAELHGKALIDINKASARLYIMDFPEYKRLRSKIARVNDKFDSPQMRMTFIVDMLMQADSPYLIDELAYAMNISRSTMIKDLNALKKILKDYSLTIQGQSGIGISLKGKELSLRFFILDNNYEVICGEMTLPKKAVSLIKTQFALLKLDRLVLDDFLRYLMLSFYRIKQNHTIVSLEAKYQALKNHYYYKFLQPCLNELENILKIKLNEKERIFLTIPLISMRTPYDISSLAAKISVSDNICRITRKIIASIRDNMQINIDEENSDIFAEFVYHNYFLINRLRFGLPMHNQSSEDVRKKYTVAYHMALIAKEVIEEDTRLSVPESEVYYLTAYFQIFLTENSKKKNIYKVALFCGAGRAETKLVLSQLRKIFETATTIDIISHSEYLNSEYLKKYDLLLSTLKIDLILPIPVVFISEVIDEAYLRNKIDRIRYAQQLQIPLLRGVRSIIFNLLSEEHVLVLNKSLTYEEGIEKLLAASHDESMLAGSFRRQLREREAKSSMVLDKFVAFPHAKYNGDKVIILLGLIPDGLSDALHPELKIIFLVAIPQNPKDDTVLVKIYDEIISMAADKKIIDDMSRLAGYHDILMYFIKDCDLFN